MYMACFILDLNENGTWICSGDDPVVPYNERSMHQIRLYSPELTRYLDEAFATCRNEGSSP